MTAQQVAEKEMWGKSLNGYIGGGNFDENPKLERYTLQKYQQMKDNGELRNISRLDDSKREDTLQFQS